ncbi:MAG TPA: tetratricopeptide repeat protein [Pyrinomonadaceae bacterium]|nr:tetratricopeptide repeat protein [Pyrinomonadaceae bacterium]
MTANERALSKCEKALGLKDKGDYSGAQEAMRPLWNGLGEYPDIEGLHPTVAAEVLLCTGILTGWIGSKDEIKEANEWARDLLTESITYYESFQDALRIAAVHAELGYCYWRSGALDEARIWFSEAIQHLPAEGNTRANALFGLSVVEWSASRFKESLRILTENALLFKKINNHTLKGVYHMQVGMALRKLVTPENQSVEFSRIIWEYTEAEKHFRKANNKVFRAHVLNNIGNVLCDQSRFSEAHEYLNHARRLTVSARDKVKTAQIDDSRAQLFIAEGKYVEAESTARHAVKTFKKSGHQFFLAEALTTHGIALARLGRTGRAQFTLQEAIEVAHQAGSLNRAGIAALTLIEEIGDLAADMLAVAYEQATEWLEEAQSHTILLRFKAAGKRLAARLRTDIASNATETLLKRQKCKEELLQIEEARIRKALAEANGRVTGAATLIGVTYPGLIYIINHRHPHLLAERSPVRERKRRK